MGIIKAEKFFKEACDNGIKRGCFNLGKIEHNRGNIAKAERLLKETCDSGIKKGCFFAGLIEENRGNITKAEKLFKQARNSGVKQGHVNLRSPGSKEKEIPQSDFKNDDIPWTILWTILGYLLISIILSGGITIIYLVYKILTDFSRFKDNAMKFINETVRKFFTDSFTIILLLLSFIHYTF